MPEVDYSVSVSSNAWQARGKRAYILFQAGFFQSLLFGARTRGCFQIKAVERASPFHFHFTHPPSPSLHQPCALFLSPLQPTSNSGASSSSENCCDSEDSGSQVSPTERQGELARCTVCMLRLCFLAWGWSGSA